MGKVIGIDLGTTMSAMAIVDELGQPIIIRNQEGSNLTPSAILIRGDERIVGDRAKRAAVARPKNVVQFVKRRMFDPNYEFIDAEGRKHRPEELSALILKKLKQDAERALGEEVTHAVITVPAYFGDLERNRTKQAGEIAGFEVLDIINEPTAAAIAFGVRKMSDDMTIIVYDLGGGTFDITLMQVTNSDFKVLASDGNKLLGGGDFDEEICEYFAEEFLSQHKINPLNDLKSYQDFRDKAEAAKIDLSADSEAYVTLFAEGKVLDIDLTRKKFEELIVHFIDQTQHLMKQVLTETKLNWSDIDKVLLVGGSTRVPLVQNMVKNLTGKEPEVGFNPDEVVAMGAAIYASTLGANLGIKEAKTPRSLDGTLLPAINIRDVTANSLGVVAFDKGDRLKNFIIIRKNSEIPIKVKRQDTFTTVKDNQTSVEFQIVEGEDEDPTECTNVGEAVYLSGIPPQPEGVPQIEVTLSYDKSGIVGIYAKDLGSGRDIQAEIKYEALLSRSELEHARANVSALRIR